VQSYKTRNPITGALSPLVTMGQATNQHVSWYLQVQRIGADVWCDRDRSRVDIRLADGRQSL